MTDLKKPDLSKDTTGPFVTRDGRKAVYVPLPIPMAKHLFQLPSGPTFWVRPDGREYCNEEGSLDIFLAPKEPKTVFVNWYEFGQGNCQFETAQRAREKAGSGVLALLQLEVDDQGVPVHNSVVRRVEG